MPRPPRRDRVANARDRRERLIEESQVGVAGGDNREPVGTLAFVRDGVRRTESQGKRAISSLYITGLSLRLTDVGQALHRVCRVVDITSIFESNRGDRTRCGEIPALSILTAHRGA